MGSLFVKPPKQQEEGGVALRPVLPWTTRLNIFFFGTFINLSMRPDGTLNRRIFNFLELCGFSSPPNPKPRHGVWTSDVTVDPSHNLWFRIFVPCSRSEESDARLPVVLFFHGGGFILFSPNLKACDDFGRRLAREANTVIVSVNYRLAPEHRYPAQFEDGLEVLKFLDDRKDVLPENADVSRCFLAGDSAGANVAHHVAKRVCESNPLTRVQVIGVMSIQAFFGGEERTKSEIELAKVDKIVTVERTTWMWKAFIPPGAEMDRDHEVINVSGPNAADISKLECFPATMVVVSGFDSLKDWQLRYYEYLKKSGKEAYLVEFPDTIHGFYLFPELPQSDMLYSEARKFIDSQCSKIQNLRPNY